MSKEKEEIIAFTADGKPLSVAEYKKELATSEEEILRGKVISQDDLEKEAEK